MHRKTKHSKPIKTLIVCLLFGVGLLLASTIFAANSKPTIDNALRTKLKAAINASTSFEDKYAAQVWLVQKSNVLKRFIKDPQKRLDLLRMIHHEATVADVPPEFVLAVIEIESSFNQYALSYVGARGLMQVMPFWKNEIGRKEDNLMDIQTNLRYGCTILKHYYDRAKGNWSEALARYNGSYGKLKYPEKVMVAWQKYWR